MQLPASWKERGRALRREVYALRLAYKDPRVPWYAKAFAACVVAYALSPIDLIPDPIPVIGHLDDLVLVPLGIYLTLKMIPPEVMIQCRERARDVEASGGRSKSRIAAAVIVSIWAITAIVLVTVALRVAR